MTVKDIPSPLVPYQDGYRIPKGWSVSNSRFMTIAQTMRDKGFRYCGAGIFRRDCDVI